ncbi:MAG TPA: IS66 family transposase, partial [Desulfobacteraceae bacterium]|nr:IS66 family transposase [Desulfobacteraceae bacterium]
MMSVAENSSELPNDIEELKQVILSQNEEIKNYHDEITQWKTTHSKALKKYRELEEKFRILQNSLYGRSSEKWSADEHLQASLFNEAEIAADEEGPLEKACTETTTFTVTRKARGKRQPIPDWVPRKEIVHDIAEEEKTCGCGAALVQIGEEVSEQIDYIPARMEAIRHIRPKYACPSCEGSGDEDKPAVRIAPAPKVLLPKSIATAGLVSQIVT